MTCGRCEGKGTVVKTLRTTFGQVVTTKVVSCPECGGKGALPDDEWTEQDDVGAVTIHETGRKK